MVGNPSVGMPRKILTTFLFLTFTVSAPWVYAQSSLCFTSASDHLIRTGVATQSVVVRDFDKNGSLDMVAANTGGNSIAFVRSDGSRTYASPNVISTIDAPWIVVSEDFNNDGTYDLAVSTLLGHVVIIPGNGDGTFGDSTRYEGLEPSNKLVAVDINKDENVDLIVLQSSALIALFGDGTGHFGEPVVIKELDGDVRTFICADFSGDDTIDIAVVDLGQLYIYSSAGGEQFTGGDVVAVDDEWFVNADFNDDDNQDLLFPGVGKLFPGNGDGGFLTPVDIPKFAVFGDLTANDFNKDGFMDVATANYYGSVDIMYANGLASFDEHVSLYAGASPVNINSADMDGDSNIDLVVAEANTIGGVYILYNDGGFPSNGGFDGGDNARAVFANDMNDDGRADIVISNSDKSKVYTLLQDGDGAFPNSVVSELDFGNGSVVTGDFNGDGKQDAASNQENGDVQIFYGDGEASFTEGPTFQYNIGTMAGADFNGDAKPDLVGTLNSTNFVGVLIGDGAGNFTQTDISVNVFASAIYTGDFNGDEKTDIAVAAFMDNKLSVLPGNGDGTFGTATSMSVDITLPQTFSTDDFYVADLNGDGKDDLVTSAPGASDNNVRVLINDGSSFQTLATIEVSYEGKSITSGYFDPDDKIDLAIGGQGIHNILIYTGNGDGTFSGPISFASGLTDFIFSADLGNDGSTDIITSQWTTGNIVILQNNTARITKVGTITACGETVNLVANNNGYNYQWSGPEGAKSGKTISAGTRGTYTLIVSGMNDQCKTMASVTIDGKPALPETSVVNPTCLVATGSIVVTKQNGDDLYSFDNGSTFTSDNLMPGLTPGDYDVIIQDENGCNSKNTITTVESQPERPDQPVVDAIDPSCTDNLGSMIVAVQKAGDTYSFDGGQTFQGVNEQDDVAVGDYKVLIRRSIDCVSDTTTVVINHGPEIPSQPMISVVSTDGSIKLQSSQANGYEWQKDDQPIENATAQTYDAIETGAYAVVVLSVDGCRSEPSLPYNVVISGDIDDAIVGFYPNPADSYIYYRTTDPLLESAIYNIGGKKIGIPQTRTSEQLIYDVRDLSPGVYLLKITSGTAAKTIRWVKR